MGDLAFVRSLVKRGAKVDSVEDSFYKTALHRATIKGYNTIVEFLLDKGASVDARVVTHHYIMGWKEAIWTWSSSSLTMGLTST